MKNHIDTGEGSITKNILRLAWPMMIGMFFQTLFNVVDAIYLGRYSAEAIAAVSLSFPVIFLIIAVAAGVGIGVTSLIARQLGAKKKIDADNTAEHGILMGGVIAVLVTIFGLALSRPLFAYIGASDVLMPLVLEYVKIIFGGSIFMFAAFMVNSILRGEGDTKTPMKIMLVATITNIVIDPIFIFGFGLVPEMGVRGAAIATILSRALSAIMGLYFIFSGKSMIKFDWSHFKFRWQIVKDILKIGIPASMSQSLMSLGFLFLTKIVASFGDYAIAAFGIVGRLDSVAILPIIGIASATVTIVGFNIGANDIERAEKTAWRAAGLALIFGTIWGLIYFSSPKTFIMIFTEHPEIIAIGTTYLRILALFTGYTAILIVISSTFQGIGKAVPALVLVMIRMFVLLIPFAWLFGVKLGLGLDLVWWSFPVSGVLASSIGMIWFKMGRWKKSCRVEAVSLD